jgi:uncharacterized protein
MKPSLPSETFDIFMPLKGAELNELDRFLVSDATSDETLTLSGLDGYMTALVIGPMTVAPSLWLPGVWGPSDDHAPEFESDAQAQRIMAMLFRHMNSIVAEFENDPESFEPIFHTREYKGRDYACGEAWALGFMQGVELVRADWQPLYDRTDKADIIRPLHLLGSEDLTDEEQALTETPAQREELSRQIARCLVKVHDFWMPYRIRAAANTAPRDTVYRSGPKVGRNDPCPCGSGAKFKKCCGIVATGQ